MLVSGRKPEKLDKLLNCYDIDLLILDGSLSAYHAKAWKQAALEAGVKFYHTTQQGAYIYETRLGY